MPQAMKIPAAKAAVDKEWEKLEKIPASQKQIRGDRWSKDEWRKSSFCIINGHMSSENAELGAQDKQLMQYPLTPR